ITRPPPTVAESCSRPPWEFADVVYSAIPDRGQTKESRSPACSSSAGPGSSSAGRTESLQPCSERRLIARQRLHHPQRPGGLARGIYAARANLKPLVYEGKAQPDMIPLGQLA